jgi:hypothetical protein
MFNSRENVRIDMESLNFSWSANGNSTILKFKFQMSILRSRYKGIKLDLISVNRPPTLNLV